MYTVDSSSVAWLDGQRKFRELAPTARNIGEKIEHQAVILIKALEILKGVDPGAPHVSSRSGDSASAEGGVDMRMTASDAPQSSEV